MHGNSNGGEEINSFDDNSMEIVQEEQNNGMASYTDSISGLLSGKNPNKSGHSSGFGGGIPGLIRPSSSNSVGGVVFDPVQVFCPVDLTFPGIARASASPPVYVIENFLPAELCERLMAETNEYLVRAPVVGLGNGEISAARTSSTCYLDRSQVPSVVTRVSRLLQGKPIEHVELPQVGRYLQGEEYRAHYDAFDLNSADGRRFAENGGQRVCTVLIYLNDVAVGGQTVFPSLKFALQPKQGRALIFFPATMDGVLDPAALHGKKISNLALVFISKLTDFFLFCSRNASCRD
jgi:prolyl 4-hydroxylase